MNQWLFFIIFIIVKNIYTWWIFLNWPETSKLAIELSLLAFQNDLYIAFSIFFLVFFTKNIKNKKITVANWLIILLLSLLIFLDIQTLFTFNRKLNIMDLFKFSNNGMESYFVIKYFILGLTLYIISFSLLYLYTRIKSKKINLTLLILVVLSFFLPLNIHYLKSKYITKNFIQNNLSFTYAKEHSSAKNLHDDFINNFSVKKGQNKKVNIIVILAESWSAIDSSRTSGIGISNLDAFDKISHEGKIFTNFFAEGSTTDQAYVSLFTGLPPLLYNLNNDSYTPFYTKNDSLIDFLNKQDYYTSFVKAYSLDFLGLRNFLQNLHFDKMVGKNEAFFNQKTYSMNGVADDTVYDYILDNIPNIKEPYFITMTTLSTHIPFYTPKGLGEHNSYTYSAEAFKRFYTKLKNTGYLKNNYLILLGDHRKMTPLNAGEYNNYKQSAYARVTCAMWGGDTKVNSIDKNYYNQTDITNSIKELLGDSIKLPKNYNNIFTQEINRDFIIHDSFDSRSEVLVIDTKNNISTLKLDGDSSKFISGLENKNALKYINNIRGYYQFR